MQDFKQLPFEKRLNDCQKVRKKFPTKVPVIVMKAPTCELPVLEKEKFLIPQDLSVMEFQGIIRKKLILDEKRSLTLLVNDRIMPKADSLMSEIYESHRDADGFLYVLYTDEDVSG